MQHVIARPVMTSTASLLNAARHSGRHCAVDHPVTTDLRLSASCTVLVIIAKMAVLP